MNNYLVLFTTKVTTEDGNRHQVDRIYRIDMDKDAPELFILFEGE
jgi:hypothetical protein